TQRQAWTEERPQTETEMEQQETVAKLDARAAELARLVADFEADGKPVERDARREQAAESTGDANETAAEGNSETVEDVIERLRTLSLLSEKSEPEPQEDLAPREDVSA